jgi:carbon-monoxide dehydrogenase medium subunit
MWPSNFDYHRASSVEEAIQLLSNNEDAKLLAGGHSLIPAMKLRLAQPTMLVDIGHIDSLKNISANGSLRIGALATHAQIAASGDVRAYCGALATATGLVGDPQVRNWGTLGGNIAHADPASDPPTVVLACGGTIHLQGRSGSRSVAAEDFFIGLFEVDMNADELITASELPDLRNVKTAYAKLSHPASRYAIVGVSVALEMNGSSCSNASVAIGGATAKPILSGGAADALIGSDLGEAALNAAASALQADIADELIGDITAPEAYRHAMAGVYLKRAVRAAVG